MVQTMSGQIIPLKCPSCGNIHNEQLREHVFGADFKCESCGMTSVLVINKQLHLRQMGEHVCKSCGRLAPKGTRFCQCGLTLIQKCTDCRHEYFIDDQICPQCGWLASTEWHSEAGVNLMFTRHHSNLTSHLFEEQKAGWAAIDKYLIELSKTEKLLDLQQRIVALHIAQIIKGTPSRMAGMNPGKINDWGSRFRREKDDFYMIGYSLAADLGVHRGIIVEALSALVRSDSLQKPYISTAAISALATFGSIAIPPLESILLKPSPHHWKDYLGYTTADEPPFMAWYLCKALWRTNEGRKILEYQTKGLFVPSYMKQLRKWTFNWGGDDY